MACVIRPRRTMMKTIETIAPAQAPRAARLAAPGGGAARSCLQRLSRLRAGRARPLDPAVVTVGSIHGGTKGNIIPDEVKLQLTLRSYSDDVRAHSIEAVKRICRGEAIAAGIPDNLMPIVTVVA